MHAGCRVKQQGAYGRNGKTQNHSILVSDPLYDHPGRKRHQSVGQEKVELH